MRGMQEAEVTKVADWIYQVSCIIQDFHYKETKEERKQELQRFRDFISQNQPLQSIREQVRELCLTFPIYR